MHGLSVAASGPHSYPSASPIQGRSVAAYIGSLHRCTAKKRVITPGNIAYSMYLYTKQNTYRCKSESKKIRTPKMFRIRFGLRWVIQCFLGQFLAGPLAIANFTHFSALWTHGAQFSERYRILRLSLYISDSQRTSGRQKTIYKCVE